VRDHLVDPIMATRSAAARTRPGSAKSRRVSSSQDLPITANPLSDEDGSPCKADADAPPGAMGDVKDPLSRSDSSRRRSIMSSRRNSHTSPRNSVGDSDEEEEDAVEAALRENAESFTGCRKAVYLFVSNKYFDRTILGFIGINCIMMALWDPLDGKNDNTRNQVLEKLEYVVLGIFTSEMLLKWIAYGIPGYFTVNWNILDAVVVTVAWAALIPGVANFSALRLLKAFRPLRTMGKSGGMRKIIDVIMLATRSLIDVFFLCCLVFFIFGIVGIQLFQGTLTQHCFSSTGQLYQPADDNGFRTCGGRFECPTGYQCMIGTSDQYAAQGLGPTGNPNGGVTSFDDIGHAFLSIFVAITLEGWVDVMYMVQDSYSDAVSSIYFVLMVLLGSLFVLNLALAVVADEYDAQGDDEEDEDEEDSDAEQDKAMQVLADDKDSNFMVKMAVSSWFNNLVFVFILFNTITLACEHVRTRTVCPGDSWTTDYSGRAGTDGSCISQAVEMQNEFSKALEYINFIFVAVFTIELLVKLIGLGPRMYAADKFNLFDATIVVVSFIELGVGSDSSLSVLRAFRLGRVFKMAKSWDSLRAVIETIAETLPSVGYLSILLFLFMFIASVAGMQLFGGKMQSNRSNYDNFGVGMLTTFQILSGENWNEVLYDAINSTSYGAIVYFLLVVVIGNFLVLNLFLAILLSKFSTGDAPDMSIEAILGAIKSCLPGVANSQVTPEDEASQAMDDVDQQLEEKFGRKSMTGLTDSFVPKRLSLAKLYQKEAQRQADEEAKKADAGWTGPSDPEKPLVCTGNAFFCLGPTNCLRVGLGKVVDCPLFQNFILLCIFISSMLLAADEPGLDPDSDFANFLKLTDWVFTILFSVELVMKVIVYGLMFTPDAYLRDGWNVLDTFIVAVSIWSLGSGGTGGAFKALRALRALKPLRTIKRAPGLKVVVDAILACMPSFLNIGMVSVLFYLVFAIIGVQFWAGKFWTCNDLSVANVSECVGTYTEGGDTVERSWDNASMNFDNVGNAMLTLFEVASLELWLDVMYSSMDVPSDLGGQPERNQSAYFCLYFVFFVVFGSFLVMNLFVGAVVDNFTQAKADDEDTDDLSQEQLDFMDSLEMILNEKPYPKAGMPQGTNCISGIRRVCFKICMWDRFTPYYTGTSFDIVISTLILLNVIVMSMYVWEAPSNIIVVDSDLADEAQDSSYNDVLELVNHCFTWIFFVEMVIKLIGLGVYQYARDHWNKLDAFVVIVSVISFVVQQALGSITVINPSIIRTVRAFRVIRVFRLLKGKFGRGVLALLETLVQSLPALANVSALLVLVLFIYACLGMSFFGTISTSPSTTGDVSDFDGMPYKMYNEHCNFKTFYRSFLLLFRMSTGESWNGIMHDVMHVHVLAWFYFVTYMVVVAYLLFNLLVAVVLEQFSMKMHQQQLMVNPTHIASFVEHWRRFDPNCTHLIKVQDLPVLMQALEPPLGFAPGVSRVAIFRDDLYVPNHHGQVHFVELFAALLKFAYGAEEIDNLENSRLTQMAMQIGYEFPSLINVYDDGGFAEAYAATRLQAMLHGSLWRDQPEAEAEATGANAADDLSKVGSWFKSKLKPVISADKADNAVPAAGIELAPGNEKADEAALSKEMSKEAFPAPPALDGHESGPHSRPATGDLGDPNEQSLEDSDPPAVLLQADAKADPAEANPAAAAST